MNNKDKDLLYNIKNPWHAIGGLFDGGKPSNNVYSTYLCSYRKGEYREVKGTNTSDYGDFLRRHSLGGAVCLACLAVVQKVQSLRSKRRLARGEDLLKPKTVGTSLLEEADFAYKTLLVWDKSYDPYPMCICDHPEYKHAKDPMTTFGFGRACCAGFCACTNFASHGNKEAHLSKCMADELEGLKSPCRRCGHRYRKGIGSQHEGTINNCPNCNETSYYG